MMSMNIKCKCLKYEKIKYGANTTSPQSYEAFQSSCTCVQQEDVLLCVGVRGSVCVCVCVNYPSLIKESGQGVAMETQLYTSCHSD